MLIVSDKNENIFDKNEGQISGVRRTFIWGGGGGGLLKKKSWHDDHIQNIPLEYSLLFYVVESEINATNETVTF